jgi:hypothetical protein
LELPRMNLEIVTVCVDMADFLTETLPLNLRQCDRMVVVSAPEDYETQRVCEFWDVDVVLTDAFQGRWGEFHKAKGINAGLRQLSMNGWVMHLDVDCALPPRARVLLDRGNPDRRWIFGADRMRVPSYDAWRAHQAMPTIQHDGYHVRFDEFKIMPRFNAWHLNGYAPPGYFQLWHPQVSGVRAYPDEHHNGDKTDILHAAQWPSERRGLWPTFAVYHLEAGWAELAANWGGRKTERFGPEPDLAARDVPALGRHSIKPFRHIYDRSTGDVPLRYGPPWNRVAPAIQEVARYEGTPQLGETLTLHPGEWLGSEPIALLVRWQRGGPAHGWGDIPGAVESVSGSLTYTVAPADVGFQLRGRVVARNRDGDGEANTAPSAVVAA